MLAIPLPSENFIHSRNLGRYRPQCGPKQDGNLNALFAREIPCSFCAERQARRAGPCFRQLCFGRTGMLPPRGASALRAPSRPRQWRRTNPLRGPLPAGRRISRCSGRRRCRNTRRVTNHPDGPGLRLCHIPRLFVLDFFLHGIDPFPPRRVIRQNESPAV